MGLITITGQPGCRVDEVARILRKILSFELLPGSRIESLLAKEFGSAEAVPEKAWLDAAASLLAPILPQRHLIVTGNSVHLMGKIFPGTLRVQIVAPEAVRTGALMVDHRLDRPAARALLRDLEQKNADVLEKRGGRRRTLPEHFDLVVNGETLPSEALASIIRETCVTAGIEDRGLLSPAVASQIEFKIRLRLARHGLTPPGSVGLARRVFAHPSEEIFANLLDFYRIAWEYEPRSFPVQWDSGGNVSESFTPDFYLPEFDLYVELTTMKQSLVTRKNRKVKLLRDIYPYINIQVFYQKDFENLIFKYGLAERAAPLA